MMLHGDLMARKKSSATKNQTAQAKASALQSKTDREDKILNAMVNTSVILMSTMMDAFAQVMVKTTSALAEGISEAFGGKEAEKQVDAEFKQKLPEVDGKMKGMISDIRKDIYAQMGQKRREIEPLLSDPVFDVGPEIIEKYDFNLPKLSEELDDAALAQYSQLLVSEDPRFAEMFKELAGWLNSLPKPPESVEGKVKSGSPRSRKRSSAP